MAGHENVATVYSRYSIPDLMGGAGALCYELAKPFHLGLHGWYERGHTCTDCTATQKRIGTFLYGRLEIT